MSSTKQTENINKIIPRPPVVVVMGHIDHGKSTLLDYIRKTNVVDTETGGITQAISAYEVVHKEDGAEKKITFLDTPGHAAFTKMRERGAKVADIAILIVSAEDSVKPQTIEAYKTILESKTPYVVAINKIDKPGANVEKTKMDLAENEIYLENYGGNVPFAEISAKTGAGVDELLSLINVLAEMETLTGDPSLDASGLVIEANLDPKRGIQASLIIKNGSIKNGMFVAVGDSICSTRIIENFKGAMIKEATFSSPIRLVGFDKMPQVGSTFQAFSSKDEALEYAKNFKENNSTKKEAAEDNNKKVIPIILKADTFGSIEAIEKEIAKLKNDTTEFRIISKGAGPLGEADLKNVTEDNVLVIGFNVKADKNANDIAQNRNIKINLFDIIYKMTEWLETELEARKQKVETVEVSGRAKILKAFSRTKERQILGGKVTEGHITLDSNIKIMRRDFEIGSGKIVNLEKAKSKTREVEEGVEFGMMLESKIEIVPGDVIECFAVVYK
jgi:translation initiation factor IF-2